MFVPDYDDGDKKRERGSSKIRNEERDQIRNSCLPGPQEQSNARTFSHAAAYRLPGVSSCHRLYTSTFAFVATKYAQYRRATRHPASSVTTASKCRHPYRKIHSAQAQTKRCIAHRHHRLFSSRAAYEQARDTSGGFERWRGEAAMDSADAGAMGRAGHCCVDSGHRIVCVGHSLDEARGRVAATWVVDWSS